MSEMKEGQMVYAVPIDKRYGKPCTGAVVKVGRKWAYVKFPGHYGEMRVDKRTWIQADTGYGCGRDYYFYESKSEYERIIERRKRIKEFEEYLSRGAIDSGWMDKFLELFEEFKKANPDVVEHWRSVI